MDSIDSHNDLIDKLSHLSEYFIYQSTSLNQSYNFECSDVLLDRNDFQVSSIAMIALNP